MDENEILEFELDKQSFGIDISTVEEISGAREITNVPNSHPSIEGIYVRRGGVTTVLNLRNCLGKEQEYPILGEFIVIRINEVEIAIHVDSVAGIHKLSKKDIIEPSIINKTNAVQAIANVQNRLITVINIENIVSEITETQEEI